jgi:hypothetical protein
MPDVLFRDSKDYRYQVATSFDWRVWRINEKFRDVGKLEGENQKAEIGIVVAPQFLVIRMRTGRHEFRYPGY